jgi:hypothetical protein
MRPRICAVADALRTGKLERALPEWHVQTLRLHAAVPTRRFQPWQLRDATNDIDPRTCQAVPPCTRPGHVRKRRRRDRCL